MAISAISSPDISILRGNGHSQSLKVDITPLTVVQSGAITAITSTYPTVSFTWDGSTSGIVVGQMVRIMSGSTVKTWGVIRKAPVSSTLYISETPLGASGYAENIESALAVSDTVTVYNHHPLWGLHSRINNRTFYKQWDVAYSDQNENVPPVANTGKWQSKNITSGTATVRLPHAGSNTSFAMSGTLSSYLWTLPSGVTLASGYATSDSVIEVEAEAGTHQISLRVTDSNAKTHTAYMWLFVSDGTTGTSLSERYAINSVSIDQSQTGFSGSFDIIGTNLEDILYPGAGLLFTETPYFEDGTLTDGVLVDTHNGYIVGIDYTYDNGRVSRATVTFEAPITYTNRVVQPVQSMTEVSNPANWAEVTSALSNPRGAFYYAVKWHIPALLDMHDFSVSGFTTPRRKFIDFNTKTAGAAIDNVSKMFLCNVGSMADGTTIMKLYPQYMSNTDRNNLATRMAWQAQDFRLPLRYTKTLIDKPAEARTGAFAYNGSASKAWLAGKLWNQGTGEVTLPNFTVTTSEGITRIKEVVGHFYAEQSAKIRELTLDLNGNMDVVEPPAMIWDTLTIGATYDPDGVGFSTDRMIAKRVTRTWTKGENGLEKTVTVAWQPETFGQPGEEIPIGNVKSSNGTNGGSTPVAFAPQVNDALGALGIMMVVNETGQLALTYNYQAVSPEWGDLSDSFDGAVCDFCWDYNSAFFTSGFVLTEALGAYVVSINGTSFNVYRIPDILNNPFVVDLLETATMNDSSADYTGRIECSETTPTLVVAAWHDQTGIEFIRSLNGGASWSSKVNVGSATTDTANDDAHMGLAIYGAAQAITGFDGTDYALYYAPTAGASFSKVTNSEVSDMPIPLIKLLTATLALATIAVTIPGTSITTVDFDSGYGSYSIPSSITGAGSDGMDSRGESAIGNPGDGARALKTGGTSGVPRSLYVAITFGSPVVVSKIEIDYYLNMVVSSTGTPRFAVYVRDGGASGTEQITGFGATIVSPLTNDAAWHTISTDDETTTFWSDNAPYTGDYVAIRLLAQPNGITTLDYRLDNIKITTVTGSGTTTYTVYHVEDIDGSSVWTDISPVADEAPIRPHDLSIDVIDNTVLHMVTNDDKYRRSANTGTTWNTEESATDKRVPYSVGDAIAIGGVSEVKLSLDGGTSFDDKTGNLALAWGSVGTIKRLLAL